ncbi:MAG TPA: response regulator, partial [Acidimicrobiales bacterium]
MTAPVRVLVVDDEPYITDVVSSALAFEGFATEEASTVAGALAHARSGGFDCIVLDVLLPDGDGFEVCRTLRDEEIATPVLFLTARD